MPDRRHLLALAGGLAGLSAAGRTAVAASRRLAGPTAVEDHIRILERRIGGRLGVAALDLGAGRRVAHRAGERFPMCSTFKWLLAAAVLARVDRGAERLDRAVRYGRADLLDHAPAAEAHLAAGAMSVGQLCAAAVSLSDNTAANLLLASLGGPQAFTRFVRSLGDPVTRLDRNEPSLNTAIPADPRDTTSPSAMVADLRTILAGRSLLPGSRFQLLRWMQATSTGAARLRAAAPTGWMVGDKTGTGAHASTNDLGIVQPPGRAPILIAVYFTGSPAPLEAREAAIASVGRLVFGAFGAPAHG